MILDDIVAARRRGLTGRDPVADEARREQARALGAHGQRSLVAALRQGPTRPAVIAEFKRRSPSAGPIRPGADPAAIARGYAAAGAAALSVLTNEDFFDGTLADVAPARAAAGLPALRKDFLLEEVDLVDARLAGADAVLLIARLLDDARLARLLEGATELGLEALVEVHDEREWERAIAAGAVLIGVNHRDLDTLRMDLSLSARVARSRPRGVTLVAESGLRSRDDLALMHERGFDAVLVGEALMRADSPGEALSALVRGLAR